MTDLLVVAKDICFGTPKLVQIDEHHNLEAHSWDCLWRSISFRQFCHLFCVLWETCETVTVTAFLRFILFVTVWLKASWSLHTVLSHSCSLWRKRDFIETIPVIIHLTDLLLVSIQKIVSEEEDLVVRKGSVDLVLFKVRQHWWLTMRKLLTTSLQKNSNKTAEATVGSFRAQSTDEWTAASGMTWKIPQLFDGLTSWFKYEELIEDWLDLTVLEASQWGPALKNRLISELQKSVKGLLNRESLRADDGVEYFRDTLRPHYVKGAQNVVLWRFYFTYSSKEKEHGDGRLDRQVFFALETFERFMDGLVTVVCHESATKRESIPGWCDPLKCRKTYQKIEEAMHLNEQATRGNWNATHGTTHGSLFPFNDNLTTFMFIVASDLNEAQRERVTSSLCLRWMTITACTLDAVQRVFVDYSVRRKAPWRILLSAWSDTAAVQAEPSSSKTILKMSMDNGLLTK